MYWTKKHVLVCTASHCAQKGANEVVGKLRLEIVRRGLDSQILVNNCGTIDLCDIGPNLVVYPDNVILSGVTVRDLPEVIEYLKGGEEVSRLVTSQDSEDEQQRHSFYARVLQSPSPLSTEQFLSIAEENGYDARWVDEQARRGFIARKPGENEGQQIVVVTKKARDRYRLNETETGSG